MSQFSHFDEAGASRMVDVGGKNVTERLARAVAYVSLAAETLAQIRDGKVLKGNVFEVARLAGIMAAKRTRTSAPCVARYQWTRPKSTSRWWTSER